MTPRHQNLMRLLSTGKPTTDKELTRELGWSLDAVHRALIRLAADGHVETVLVNGKAQYTVRKSKPETSVTRVVRLAPALHSIWN